jgi:hypothetical protein
VIAVDSGKKINFPTHINITCEKRPINREGGGMSLSRTVGGADSNPTLNAVNIKRVAEDKISDLASDVMNDFTKLYNFTLDAAGADSCGAILSCSVSCSLTVS